MLLAAGVLAILVTPLVVIGLDPYPETTLYKAALFALIGVGIVALIVAVVLEPNKGPSQPVDERRMDRYMNVLALFGALVVAVSALLFSTSRLSLTVVICGLAVVWALVWLPAFTRRVAVQTQVFIDRDPKAVFNFMLDERNGVQYTPDLLSVEKITPGDVGPGTRFLSRVRLGDTGIYEGVEEIVAVDWGQRIVDRVANGTRPNQGVMTFEAAQRGTLLTYRFGSEVSYPTALFGQALMRWALTGEMRRRRMEIWARLKQLLESQPDSA